MASNVYELRPGAEWLAAQDAGQHVFEVSRPVDPECPSEYVLDLLTRSLWGAVARYDTLTAEGALPVLEHCHDLVGRQLS